MTLKQFIKLYDKKNAVVLLEGKRVVLEIDQHKLIDIGKLLARLTKNVIFRSGNATGADSYFSQGVCSVDNSRLQVITPYTGHRLKSDQSYHNISLENINLASEPDVVYQSKMNRKMEGLIDKYVAGNKNRYTIKAAYIIRDTVKAIGTENIKPATFGIFYDDLSNPKTGGTGHTMNICERNNIPIIDQTIWFDWLK